MSKKIILTIIAIILLVVLSYFGYLLYVQKSIESMQPIPESVNADKVSYTLDDISKHSVIADCWMAINNKVLNVTTFIPIHPGGSIIVSGCGKDASNYFNGVGEHVKPVVNALVSKFTIGSLKK